MMFLWVDKTPFGWPVEPDVYIMAEWSSGLTVLNSGKGTFFSGFMIMMSNCSEFMKGSISLKRA